MSFTTLENVRKFLSKPSLDEITDQPLVELLIECVDGVIENYCGWAILARDYSKVFSGNGGTSLDVGVYPLNTVSLCTIGGEDRLSAIELNSEDGEVYFDSSSGFSFTSGTRNVKIDFNAGYAEVPKDLAYAATWLVCSNFRLVDEDSIGIAKESFQSLAVEFEPNDLPFFVKRVLDRYRRVKVY